MDDNHGCGGIGRDVRASVAWLFTDVMRYPFAYGDDPWFYLFLNYLIIMVSAFGN